MATGAGQVTIPKGIRERLGFIASNEPSPDVRTGTGYLVIRSARTLPLLRRLLTDVSKTGASPYVRKPPQAPPPGDETLGFVVDNCGGLARGESEIHRRRLVSFCFAPMGGVREVSDLFLGEVML